jgi:hypothetical protein
MLGWMLTKTLWLELKPKWPATFWDDWLRLPEQRKDRACIRPELSRTLNFGKYGASNGQYFEEHIGSVKTSKDFVKFTGGNLIGMALEPFGLKELTSKEEIKSYWSGIDTLETDVRRFTKSHYDKLFIDHIYNIATQISTEQLNTLLWSKSITDEYYYKINRNAWLPADLENQGHRHPALFPNTPFYCGYYCLRRYTVIYKKSTSDDWDGFVEEAKNWKIMTDIRAGQARTAYLGVVCFKAPIKYPKSMSLIPEKSQNQQPFVLKERKETEVEVCLAPPQQFLGESG